MRNSADDSIVLSAVSILSIIPPGSIFIHRIVKRIAVPVGPHTLLLDLKPIGLDEEGEFWVIVAGVEILQARVFVVSLADPAFGLNRGGGVIDLLFLLPKRAVDGAAVFEAVRPGDATDRAKLIQMPDS